MRPAAAAAKEIEYEEQGSILTGAVCAPPPPPTDAKSAASTPTRSAASACAGEARAARHRCTGVGVLDQSNAMRSSSGKHAKNQKSKASSGGGDDDDAGDDAFLAATMVRFVPALLASCVRHSASAHNAFISSYTPLSACRSVAYSATDGVIVAGTCNCPSISDTSGSMHCDSKQSNESSVCTALAVTIGDATATGVVASGDDRGGGENHLQHCRQPLVLLILIAV